MNIASTWRARDQRFDSLFDRAVAHQLDGMTTSELLESDSAFQSLSAADLCELRFRLGEVEIGRDLLEQHVGADLDRAASLLHRAQEGGDLLLHHHLAHEGAGCDPGDVDRQRIAVMRRGTEYIVIPVSIGLRGGKETIEALHPTTGERLTLVIEDVEEIEVVK